MLDDALYFSSIFICIAFGNYYKKISDPEMKKNYGAGLGILAACFICGINIFYSAVMVSGNIILIKCVDKRYIHHLCLAFVGICLLYMHFNCEFSIYVLWFHQMMALRLAGLAFELHISNRIKQEKTSGFTSKQHLPDLELDSDPTPIDIFTYAYFFIGLHRGPYFRWKIFNEHFNTSFGTLGDCRIITEQKLKKAFLCFIAYICLKFKFSTQMYYEDEFYESYGSDYRFIYNMPHLLMFCLMCQTVMLLCTSVCTEAGFGLYPSKCQAQPGHGPITEFNLIKSTTTSESALEQEFNFSMLQCYENEKLLVGPRMKDTLRSWDMSIRYWFWVNTYKNLLKTRNKEVRSACSFFIWSIWNGLSTKQLILSSMLWMYTNLEAEYSIQYNSSGSMKFSWDIGFSIMRLLCLVYLTPCLTIDDSEVVLKYYNSIYWAYHVVMLVIFIIALSTHK